MYIVFSNLSQIKSQVKSVILVIVLLQISSSNKVFAQNRMSDSLFLVKAINNATEKYNNTIGYQSGLYNGKQYASYPYPFKEGHPFYQFAEMTKGSIVYDGQFCQNVFMQFDEVANLVIFKDETHFLS